MIGRPYKVTIKNNNGVINERRFKSLWIAIFHTLSCLEVINALDCIEDGEFITTFNPFTKEMVVKRYVIVVKAPYTVFEIKQTVKGSLNQEVLLDLLKTIKEEYFERI